LTNFIGSKFDSATFSYFVSNCQAVSEAFFVENVIQKSVKSEFSEFNSCADIGQSFPLAEKRR
jgi:hypothetical protein